MKKQRSLTILALLCASSAHANEFATPTLNQRVDSVMRRDSAMFETCKFHSELVSARQAKIDNVKNENCKKVVALFFDAVNNGWEACSDSFDMNVRGFISSSMAEALKVQGLYCTPAQALLAPCPSCDKSYIDIKRVTETFSTTEVKESLGAYSSLLPKLMEVASQNSCPEFASHADEYKNYIARLAGELSRSKVRAVRFTRQNFQPGEVRTRVQLGETNNVANRDQDFPAIRVGTGEVGSGPQIPSSGTESSQARKPAQSQTVTPAVAQNATQTSSSHSDQSSTSAASSSSSSSSTNSASKPRAPLPQGLEVTGRLSDGRIGFAYTDPKDPSKNYVGYQVRDPKTNKLKTYAYVTSRENAEAVKKNPTLCDQFINEARSRAPKSNTDGSALGRGNSLFSPNNNSKPSTDMAQDDSHQAPDSPQSQAQAQTQAGSGGTATGTSANTSTAANTGAGANTGTANVSTMGNSTGSGTIGDTSGTADNSDSQFHIASGMPKGTGLKPNARIGLDPEAKVGLKTGDTQVSSSAATSGETPQNPSTTGSGTGLKDHPNVGLDRGPSGTGIKSQIKPSPDSAQDRDGVSASTAQSDSTQDGTLRIGKPDASATSANSNASSQANEPGSEPRASSQTTTSSSKPAASQSKPKPVAKKHHPKASSPKKSETKPTATQKPIVSEYRTLAATSKGFGTVRYFLLKKFPTPEIGRWEIVDGKTEEIKYNMPADSSVIKDLTDHPEKLESAFKSTKAKFKEVKPHFLNPDVTESLNQLWLK